MTKVTGMEFTAASMAIQSAYLIFSQPRLALCGIGHVAEVTEVLDSSPRMGLAINRRNFDASDRQAIEG